MTIGVKHYKYWSVKGKNIEGKKGRCSTILCSLLTHNSNIFVGASDGSLQTWSGNSQSKSIKMHSEGIHALCIAGNNIITGSSDQTIKIVSLDGMK